MLTQVQSHSYYRTRETRRNCTRQMNRSMATLRQVTAGMKCLLHGLHALEVAAAGFNLTSTPGNKEIITSPRDVTQLDALAAIVVTSTLLQARSQIDKALVPKEMQWGEGMRPT